MHSQSINLKTQRKKFFNTRQPVIADFQISTPVNELIEKEDISPSRKIVALSQSFAMKDKVPVTPSMNRIKGQRNSVAPSDMKSNRGSSLGTVSKGGGRSNKISQNLIDCYGDTADSKFLKKLQQPCAFPATTTAGKIITKNDILTLPDILK